MSAAQTEREALCADIIAMMRQATGEDAEWSARLGPTTRLDGDLFLDSLELAALAALLTARYGPSVDLAAVVAGLDLERLVAFTVADLADLVAG